MIHLMPFTNILRVFSRLLIHTSKTSLVEPMVEIDKEITEHVANNKQLIVCQKHLFSHQLTHNMTKDCSLIPEFNT